MPLLLTIILSLFILSTHAQFSVTRKSPNATMSSNTSRFTLEIDHLVNRPSFPAFIRFLKQNTTNVTYQFDVSPNTSNATYVNTTLTFFLPDSVKWNISDEFYITFDAGVLFSNGSSNSSAQVDPQFWALKVIDSNITSNFATTNPDTTTLRTTFAVTSGSSVSATFTSMPIATTMAPTSAMNTYTGTIANMSTTTPTPSISGEPPPTRSAQWGMGIGITFISLIVLVEVIYFKFCYTNDDRSGSYYT